MAFRNRGNRASIIFSHFSLFCLGRVLYSLFLSLLFLKRSIFRLVIEGWQEGEGVSESASGVKLQSFSEKMRPRRPRNSHALWCISKAENEPWVLTLLLNRVGGRQSLRHREEFAQEWWNAWLEFSRPWVHVGTEGGVCLKRKMGVLICFSRKDL